MKRRTGFTLVEILVVLAIISILAAIIFPVFKSAQEKGYQTSCAATLHQIGMAVQQYKTEEGRYPSSMAFLLSADSKLNNVATGSPTPTPIPNTDGTGHLKLPQTALICPDDDTESTVPRSSYGDLSNDITAGPTTDLGRFVWNYWGYKDDGTAYKTPQEAKLAMDAITPTNEQLAEPAAPYYVNALNLPTPPRENPIKYSMSNRFAPPTTIITHCVYHRMPTSNLASAAEVYTDPDPANGKDAKDIVLRLDGAAKPLNIAEFKANKNWQVHNF